MRSKFLYVLLAAALVAIVIALVVSPLSPFPHAVSDADSSAVEVDLSSLAEKVSFYYVEYLPPAFERLLKSVKLDVAVKRLEPDNVTLERALVFVHSKKIAENPPKYTEILAKLLSSCRKCAIAYLNFDPKVREPEAADSLSAIERALGLIGAKIVVPLSPTIRRQTRASLKK